MKKIGRAFGWFMLFLAVCIVLVSVGVLFRQNQTRFTANLTGKIQPETVPVPSTVDITPELFKHKTKKAQAVWQSKDDSGLQLYLEIPGKPALYKVTLDNGDLYELKNYRISGNTITMNWKGNPAPALLIGLCGIIVWCLGTIIILSTTQNKQHKSVIQ